MKKLLSIVLAALMAFGLVPCAIADAPAAGSLAVQKMSVRGNSSWTLESYPEIWITPVYAEYIIEEKDAEKYPAKFLCFAPPEGAAPYEFGADNASFLHHDALLGYAYYVEDRASFELFLEKAEKDYILADGSDGVAMYVAPDNRRARAMISLEQEFGGTSKLEIYLYDYTREMDADALSEAIKAETERVRSIMRVENLDHYWSEKVFASTELYYDNLKTQIQVDTSDMTLIKLGERSLTSKVNVDGKVVETKIAIDNYTSDDVTEEKLADGTEYLRKTYDYFSYAYFPIGESKEKTVYVTIDIGVTPDEFPAEIEKVYPLITVLEQ